MNEEESCFEFHRLDAHQTRKQHGDERKKLFSLCQHLRLNFTFPGATSPKFPPEPNNKSESDESEHTEAENRQIKRWRASKGRLTLDFVGVGLLAPRHRGEDDDGGGVDDDDDDDDDERR